MFEDASFTRQEIAQRRRIRFTVVLSLTLQAAALCGFVLAPLLYPQKLPGGTVLARHTDVELVRRQPRPEIHSRPLAAKPASAARSAPAAAKVKTAVENARGGSISRKLSSSRSDAPAVITIGGGMGAPSLLASGIGSGSSVAGPDVVARIQSPGIASGALRVSSGVTSGLLLAPIQPRYPPIAVAARVEGTVILRALIDRTGRVIEIHVASGPPMLRQAAIDALKETRYKPYLLNRAPVAVETTVSVTFRLNGG